jgi:hypothetical protein
MAPFAQGSEFNMERDEFSALEIRDSGQPSGFHYFFDTKRNTLITDFILEDRQRVSTLCQITLMKKDDGFSPRIRLWKKDKTKFGKQTADHIVGDSVRAARQRAGVSIDARFAVPANLPRLVDQYAGKTPASVRFWLPSWEAALAGIPGQPNRLLSEPGTR